MKLYYFKKLWVYIIIIYIGIIFLIYLFQQWKNKPISIFSNEILPMELKKKNIFPTKEKIKIEDDRINQSDKDIKKENVLQIIYKRADGNNDGLLNKKEVSSWIEQRVKEHIIFALKENVILFTKIDLNPRNGEITWEEFHNHFLKSRGYSEEFIKQQGSSMKGMPRLIKEEIMRNKAAWSESARDNPTRLTLDEFHAFRHPESSHAIIISIVDQTLAQLDDNDDGVLSEDEFSSPYNNKVPEIQSDDDFRTQKKNEFRTIVDSNSDGKAERKELLRYFDPRGSHHATKEADALFALADADADGFLSWGEVLNHKDAFILSKMVDVAKSFHDEF